MKESYTTICFGEALWDVFPQMNVIGGAPMNVAYHLKKLDKNPAIISKVGFDNTGKALIQMLEREGICTDYFQMDFEKETGKVFVKIKDDHYPLFDIVYPVAWDYIDWDIEQEELVQQAAYFIYGSLAARHTQSKQTLFKLLECARTKVLDINLRPPFYNRAILNDLLLKADVLKLNSTELELLTGWFSNYQGEKDRIKNLQDHFQLDTILVTRKNNGAILYTGDNFYENTGYQVEVIDTIGSGDAFLAAIIAGFIDQYTPEESLDSACRLSALITSYTGACPDYNRQEMHRLIKHFVG